MDFEMTSSSNQARKQPSHNASNAMEFNRPTVSDLEGDNIYATTARQHWLTVSSTDAKKKKKTKKNAAKFNPKIVADLYGRLELEQFAPKSLLILENLQYLEKYLWPNYSEDSSDVHILSLMLMLEVKRRESLPIWTIFTSAEDSLSTFFRRVMTMSLDASFSLVIKRHILSFIISAFQSLDSPVIRKQCAPLVSIGLWQNLNSERTRLRQFEENPQHAKVWRAMTKRLEAADARGRVRIQFEHSWLFLMISNFLTLLYTPQNSVTDDGALLYCERFLEFLTDLVSQKPTRRYAAFLVEDMHTLVALKMSPLYQNPRNGLLRDMHGLLGHFLYFPIEDQSGKAVAAEEARIKHCEELSGLQRVALKEFKEKLTILALSNFASLEKRDELATHLSALDDGELVRLCDLLCLRTKFAGHVLGNLGSNFLIEVLLTKYTRHKSAEELVQDLSILPTEISLYDPSFLRNEHYNGTRPLALPKLNLQYLTVGDFLWRSFILYRSESFYEVRRDIEDAVRRAQPRYNKDTSGTTFGGLSKMALPITTVSILETGPAHVGDENPSIVRAEIALPLERQSETDKGDWEDLHQDDVVFLVALKGSSDVQQDNSDNTNFASKFGIQSIRSAEVVQILDFEGRPIKQAGRVRPGKRRLHVKLDAAMYQMDKTNEMAGKANVYESINFLVRRKGIENNFKPILDTIQKLSRSSAPLPSWFEEVFLGYGNPVSSQASTFAGRPKKIDYLDTFLDWQHLAEGFGVDVLQLSKKEKGFPAPYVLTEVPQAKAEPAPVAGKKRRKELAPRVNEESKTTYTVSTYKPPNNGPYPIDAPRRNATRYTPMQSQAIISGTSPGLTVILGPPGTGKTDVATQVVSNIYHNFPLERTLLIAHSNQALNQLFQKIAKLDIDERHLLRLGHGEDGLRAVANYSKAGRVESFMDNRSRLLSQVDRLAGSIQAVGAHGNSCETANYFFQVFVQPLWRSFQEATSGGDSAKLLEAFPFHRYFSDATQPVFPPGASFKDHFEIAEGCYRHICKIFTELADILPFELLKHPRDKQNYLLMKEARIIAMTSTHAAIKRDEIVGLGFRYDNLIFEEAAQITEIEAFIPLTLQASNSGKVSLQRIVLCGDHYQNSAIVKNDAFRKFANMEQSMFARLVRLGVPVIELDKQGRARPTIAHLYNWRYNFLGDLDKVNTEPEYLTANAGFRHELQFINVDDYKGKGEQEPTAHFLQNLGEAEYAVALFQYMRLLDYPASKITILTSYAGQRLLIRDVLNHRCSKNPLFGRPAFVTTIDRYQGEQNDYIILSLVRTKRVGYLRDIRRLTVALSRARLGLYVLGRRSVFESCFELSEAFNRLFEKPDKLQLTTGEMWPTQRLVTDDIEITEMQGVEHLGQYVFQMTNVKLQALKDSSKVGDGDVVPDA